MKAYYGLQLSADWSNCIPGCVSSARSRSDDPRRKANGILKIGGIGTIERWKGWDLVLRAIAALPAMSRKNIRFVHIGSEGDSDDSRSYAAELKERTALLGLEGSVEWRGQQPSSQGFLSEIDCLVIASNNEPFSASMLEALASGVPVLAADSGGARDIIAPPRNGWLFKSGDEMDLSRNLELLLHTDALNSVEIELADIRRFSAAHVAGEWTEVYLKLLRSK
jgi:glycosyltransferase involved in cell wall biosynthesis